MTSIELEIESLLYSKLSMKQIGYKLGISTRLINSHCNNIYEFYGIRDRIELMAEKIKYLEDYLDMQYELQAGADW